MVRSLFRIGRPFVAGILLAAGPVQAETPRVTHEPQIELVGFATPFVLDEAALRALPQAMSEFEIHGERARFLGAAFADVLRRAGAPLDAKLRGSALKTVLRAQAADGYVVVFSLAEFDPQFGDSGAVLAFERDGKPLAAGEGPFRLILPHDERAARSLRQLVRLELRTLD